MTEYATSTHKQTLGLVLAAELRRSLAAGGLRIAMIVSIGLGALAGGLTVWALAVNGTAAGVSNSALDIVPFELGVSVGALAFAVGLIGFVSREMADGTATGSAILVPRRGRLLASRLLSAVILGAAMTLAVSILVALVRLIPGGLSGAAFGRMGLVVLVVVADVMLASALAFLVATLLRKPAVAVAVFLLALIVLPLVLLIVSLVTPDWLAVPSRAILKAMPGTLFNRAMSVPTEPGVGWSNVVIGLAGLAAWVVAVAPFTWVLFDKALAGKE
jgi:ABC-type transport system involved in multi-copper enzyme maturation permease subunit